MQIHPVNDAPGDKNRFCGPAAISILTGMTTGEAARLIRHVTGKKAVMGTGTGDLRRALTICGVNTRDLHMKRREVPNPKWSGGVAKEFPTLAGWLKESVAMRTAGRVFLLVARNHWQIITGRRYCCGQTKEIISIKDKRCRRRARVTEVYEVTVPGRITIPAVARKPKAKADPFRASLAKLERAHGFKGKLEWESGFRDYVVPACPVFPRGFSTMHHGWSETEERVMMAIEDYDTHCDEDGHLSI